MLGTAYLPSSSKGLPMPAVSIIRDMNRIPPRRQPPRRPAESPASALAHATARPRSAWVDGLLKNSFHVPRGESVAQFVERFPEVIPALERPLATVRQYFPDAARIVIDTFDQAEGLSGPEYQSLLITIEMQAPAPDALQRLDRFDEDWWYALPPDTAMRVGSHLHFL